MKKELTAMGAAGLALVGVGIYFLLKTEGEAYPLPHDGDLRNPLTCWDGTVIWQEVYRDGRWVPTVERCPPLPPAYDRRVSGTDVYDASGEVAGRFADADAALRWAVGSGNATYVEAGYYTGLGEIYLPDGHTLYGDGNATILDFVNGGLIAKDVSNVTVKHFRITGSGTCQSWSDGGTVYNHLWEGIHLDHVSEGIINNAIGTFTSANGIIQNLTYRNVIVDTPATWGFLINGDLTGDHRNVLYEDCVATYCGVYNLDHHGHDGANEWIPGFDLCERSSVHGMTLRRCRADNNWESGFHIEESPIVRDVLFEDCSASYNGQKPPDFPNSQTCAAGPCYGAGCFAGNYHNTWPYCRFINFTGAGNAKGCVATVESNVAVHTFPCPFDK